MSSLYILLFFYDLLSFHHESMSIKREMKASQMILSSWNLGGRPPSFCNLDTESHHRPAFSSCPLSFILYHSVPAQLTGETLCIVAPISHWNVLSPTLPPSPFFQFFFQITLHHLHHYIMFMFRLSIKIPCYRFLRPLSCMLILRFYSILCLLRLNKLVLYLHLLMSFNFIIYLNQLFSFIPSSFPPSYLNFLQPCFHPPFF